jgi:hypothetical protein
MLSIDFEDPKVISFLRTLQYALLTIFVVGLTIVLVYVARGYDYDPDTGEVIQNGLLLVDSQPSGATVLIDGVPESDATPSRLPLRQGSYNVAISQDGYVEWKKTVTLSGSVVEWLYYPLLIPEERTIENVTALKNIEFIGQTPGGQGFLVRQTSPDPRFTLLQVRDNAIIDEEQISLSTALFSKQSGSLGMMSFAGWAADARHALIQHTDEEAPEFIWFDRDKPTESRNLNKDYALPLRDARFINGDNNRLYAVVNKDLRRLNLANNTISAPVITDVERYVLYEDRYVVYIGLVEGQRVLALYEPNQPESRILLQLEGDAADYRLEFSAYDEEFHLALLNVTTGNLQIWRDPQNVQNELGVPTLTGAVVIALQIDDPSYLSFSKNGQFAVAQSGNRFISYDFEYDRRYRFTLDQEFTPSTEAVWLDGFRLVAANTANKLVLFEFDGENSIELMTVDPKRTVWIDPAQENLYGLSLSVGGTQFLQRLNLQVEQN